MFVYNLVFLALLGSSGAQLGIPQNIQALTDENLQSEDVDGQSLVAEESIWSDVPLGMTKLETQEDQNVLTTAESYIIKELDHEGGASAVWKIALVAAALLVSMMGFLSMAYYLFVWRGGRIHYQPQKDDYA